MLPALLISAHFAQITLHTSHAQLHASAIAMAGKHAQTRSSTRAQSPRHCVHAARHASNAAMHAPMHHAPCFCVPRELAVMKPPRECTCVHMHTPPATRPAAAPPPRPVARPTGRRQPPRLHPALTHVQCWAVQPLGARALVPPRGYGPVRPRAPDRTPRGLGRSPYYTLFTPRGFGRLPYYASYKPCNL